MIYLDHAATTPVRREALEAMWPFLSGQFGNPSSHHRIGEQAAAALADARAAVAVVLGCRPGEVIFTSGGTEADNLAIKGIALASARGRHIVTTPIEHEAVLESVGYLIRHHGFEVTMLHPDRNGRVHPDELNETIRPGTALVSVHYANNEIGTVQPISELADVARNHGVPFHTDAVQSAGWMPLNIRDLGVDALSLSGHKVGAPKGIGALAIRGRVPIEPVLHGGGQERGRRSGTENVAGAVALAVALRLAEAERLRDASVVAARRDAFIQRILDTVPGAQLTGDPVHRLPGSASFVFPGINGESVLLELEQRGVTSSSGSACAAGSEEVSHVLTAIGMPSDEARTALRFTFDRTVTDDELDRAAEALAASIGAVSRLGLA